MYIVCRWWQGIREGASSKDASSGAVVMEAMCFVVAAGHKPSIKAGQTLSNKHELL